MDEREAEDNVWRKVLGEMVCREIRASTPVEGWPFINERKDPTSSEVGGKESVLIWM